ncbi:hypothetical protein ACA910_000562 [Epithemia clementina (nom. ined.)]
MEEEGRHVEYGTLAEQKDEAYFDDRPDADDDMEKGRIKFPTEKLYGRNKELQRFFEIHSLLVSQFLSRVIFLEGYSGTGKSTLVDSFVKQIPKTNSNHRMLYMSGKFDQIKTGDPFSAISQALNQFVLQAAKDFEHRELRLLNRRLAKVDIFAGSDHAKVLQDTIAPELGTLLKKGLATETSDPEIAERKSSAVIHDFNVIKFAFTNFIAALTTDVQPLTLFIDDLQWADDASLALLLGLLTDMSVNHLLFIGAYRPNEVDKEHELRNMMREVEKARGPEVVFHMEIFNLAPDSIAEFIADSIDKTPEEVGFVAEAVYKKTLGNIFFVKQALEELVRKNALYYDVMTFQWQFGDVTRVELEKYLSEDVLQMVQSKMQALPEELQKALVVAAYTKNSIDLELLAALLEAESVDVEFQNLKDLMNMAFVEGLMLRSGRWKSSNTTFYEFAHDRIREAACASVPYGKDRDNLLLRIAKVLLSKAKSGEDEWMLFTAVRHLNSLPHQLTDQMPLSEQNLTVGKIAFSKGAFHEALYFLQAGVDRLDRISCWEDHYELSLELKTYLAETENFLGNDDNALCVIENILQNAKTLVEKSRAHYCYIEATTKKNSSNYELACNTAVEVMSFYNIQIPCFPSKTQMNREKVMLKVALRGRSLMCMAKFPVATDEFQIAQMKLAALTLIYASYSKRSTLLVMVGHRMLRIALGNKTITIYLPMLLVSLGAQLRERGKYKEAFMFANAAISLMDRFPAEKGLEFIKTKMAMYGSLFCLRVSFRDAIESYLDLNKSLYSQGETELGLASGMLAMFAFLNSSLPLNALFEPKLLLLEEMSSNRAREIFVVIFSLLRQCLYNLQGGDKSSPHPSVVNGAAFNEEEALAMCEGPPRKMNFRDISTIRLLLAVIFDDEQSMEQMLERLNEYPVHDLAVARQHVRMTYTGFASLIMARKSVNIHAKWAKISTKFFQKLSRFGSPNAQPVYACMKALSKFNQAAFDEAIHVCGNPGLLNLSALMNERCGLMLLEEYNCGKRSEPIHETYLKHAVWLYHDWGATGKVMQMQNRFNFLVDAMKEKAPSLLSAIRRKAAKLGVPPPTQAGSSATDDYGDRLALSNA